MFRSDHLLVQPIWEHRAAYYDLARERGFGVEIVSFALVPIVNDPAAAAEHLRGYEAEVALSIPRTLHGPFVDVIPHSPDRLVAEVARRRVAECLEIAAKLRASHVVFHTGLNWQIRNPGYMERAAGSQGEFWASMLERFPAVTVCLENMWEPDGAVLRAILAEASHPRLKVCFDVGHAHVFSSRPARAWLEELAGDIVYLHLNDNHGDLDSELALGCGNIDWREVFAAVREMPLEPLVTLEVKSVAAVAESVELLMGEGMLPPE